MLSVWKNKTKKLSSINDTFKTESSLRPHLSILVFWFRHAAEGQLEQIVKLMKKKKERKKERHHYRRNDALKWVLNKFIPHSPSFNWVRSHFHWDSNFTVSMAIKI